MFSYIISIKKIKIKIKTSLKIKTIYKKVFFKLAVKLFSITPVLRNYEINKTQTTAEQKKRIPSLRGIRHKANTEAISILFHLSCKTTNQQENGSATRLPRRFNFLMLHRFPRPPRNDGVFYCFVFLFFLRPPVAMTEILF
ncbi:MAG: hypothetical protein DRQ51_05100 [Gammaproteobacteria bacterium]|nr:MAG: hypothetical protein DRQ51_05100 [Gammaproteobacteria bacterium]